MSWKGEPEQPFQGVINIGSDC